jgi:hypothetical protein
MQSSFLNIDSTRILSREEIKQKAPSVFTDHANEGLSEKYTHIATSTVIDDMEKLGWNVTEAREIKARKRKGYQKHMLLFTNPKIQITSEGGDTVQPRILLTNSHDGTNSFIFRCSIYRLVCENGLIVATQDFSNLKIRHMGYNFEELQSNIKSIIEQLPLTIGKMNEMVQTEMGEEKQLEFAQKAVELRFPGHTNIEVNLKDLLKATRKEDEGNNLWNTFNVIEEKLIKGDLLYNNGKKTRKLRPIKNFQQDIALNEQLWELAETYLN